MAGIAIGAEAHELSGGRVGVAGFARHGGVSSHQREAVHVILDRRYRNLPALHGMAILATRAELAAMKVGVTIRALMSDVGEDFFGMTGRAGDVRMQPPERITGLMIVIELGAGPDGSPTRGGVAASAGDFQWSVRILHRRRLSMQEPGEQAKSRH